MPSYVARRLFFAVFVLWGVVTVIFLVLRLIPGDPAILLLGPHATDAQFAAARERMGLNDPLLAQYFVYLRDVLQLDFGESFRMQMDAMELVVSRLPASARLATAAMVLSLLVGIPLGIAAALRPHSILDRAVSTFSLATQSLPPFWVGIMLILLFARTWRILPSGGSATWIHLILPAVTLALPLLAMLVRLMRGELLDVIHEGYVQTARAKGLAEHVVVFHHAVRNALIPVVTVVGLQLGTLFGGAVITEIVFAWPGVGRLLIDAIFNRDYTVVQASVFVIAAAFVLLNLVVDALYGKLDPRVRLVV